MPIYEDLCEKCQYINEYYEPLPTDQTKKCPKCGCKTDRLYSLYSSRTFESFTTRNILPNGEPVTVKGSGQLRQLENEHKVKMIDKDAQPPQTKFWVPN